MRVDGSDGVDAVVGTDAFVDYVHMLAVDVHGVGEGDVVLEDDAWEGD